MRIKEAFKGYQRALEAENMHSMKMRKVSLQVALGGAGKKLEVTH